MEFTDSNNRKISAEELMSPLLQRKAIITRFRLPIPMPEAYRLLLHGILADVTNRGRTFQDSELLRRRTAAFADWLTNEQPQFGALFCGGCGNGKTTFVKAFQKVMNHLQIKVPAGDATETLGIQIFDSVELFRLYQDDFKAWQKVCARKMIAIDDLGKEARELQTFGNTFNPMIELLSHRYERQLFTLATTNLTPPQLTEKYGERVGDRLREMMFVLPFDNSSYRTLPN